MSLWCLHRYASLFPLGTTAMPALRAIPPPRGTKKEGLAERAPCENKVCSLLISS
jgi:hypothetical protein